MAAAYLTFSDIGNTNFLLVRWAKHSTPNAYEGSLKYSAPHPQRNVTVPDLSPVFYRFEFWESSDGVTYETNTLNISVDLKSEVNAVKIFEYVVGRTESAGGTVTRTEGVIETTSDIRVFLKHSGGVTTFFNFYGTETDIESELGFVKTSLNNKWPGVTWEASYINGTLRFWTDDVVPVTFDTCDYVLLSDTNTLIPYPLTTSTQNTGGSGGSSVDPVPNDYKITDPRLAGVKEYYIEQRMTGKLKADEYNKVKDADGLYTGEWELTGWTFSQDDVYFAVVETVVAVPDAPVSSGGDYSEVVVLGSSAAMNIETHNRKLLVFDTALTVAIYTLPDFSTIPDGTKVKLQTHGGTQQYVRIVRSGVSDSIPFFGKSATTIRLGRGEMIELLWHTGKCYVLDYKGGQELVGTPFWTRKPELYLNAVPQQGGAYDLERIERLYYDHVLQLGAGQVVDDNQWNSTQTITGGRIISRYKGVFSWDDVTKKLRVPDLRGKTFKALEAQSNPWRYDNAPGGLELDGVGSFEITLTLPVTKRGDGGAPNEAVGNDPNKTFAPGTKPLKAQANGGKLFTTVENNGFIPMIYI